MRSTTYFALAVLYLSGLNLVYGLQVVTRWPDLAWLPARMPLAWLAAGKLVWGLTFGLAAWGLWRLRAWGRTLALVAFTLYQVHIWANHVLFDVSNYARQVWPFYAGLSLVSLALVWGFLFWPSVRQLYVGKGPGTPAGDGGLGGCEKR